MVEKFLVLTVCSWLATANCIAQNKEVFVINKGVGGHASADGLKRFQRDVVDVHPDWLILYFGLNDAFNPRRRTDPESFRQNMQSLIDKAVNAGITNTVLITPNPIHQETLEQRAGDHPAKKDLNGYLLQYDTIIRDLAAKNHLPLVDLRALCKQFGGGENNKDSLIRVPANGGNGDGVHLTAIGYQKFAELFVPVFKDKLKPGEVVVCFGDSVTYGAHMKGAGTIRGDTYPAWLSVYLNRLVGATDRLGPPPPLELKGLPKNGGMESVSDRVRPDFWSVWNVEGRQQGDLRIAMNQGVTGNALQLVNTKPEFPAMLLSLDLAKIDPSSTYQFRFQYQGGGRVRPLIMFYDKGNKTIGTFPEGKEDNPWRQGSDDWQSDSGTLKILAGAVKMRATFRVIGTILLDEVELSSTKTKQQQAVRPAPAAELKNQHISLQFRRPQDGGGISSIRNAGGEEFINGLDDASLWQVVLRRLPTKKHQLTDYAKLSLDPEVSDGGTATDKDDLGDSENVITLNADQITAKCKVEKSPGKIKLSWQGIDVADEKAVLDVMVEFKLAEDDRFVRVRSGIQNRSKKFTVFYLFAPRIPGIYPGDKDLAADRLAIPSFTGRLVYNPIENGILGKTRRFQPNRSGHSMQFDAYYHKGKGLYLGCFDGEQNIKRYLYESSANGLLWTMSHVPDNMQEIPQDYTVPYDTVIRCFDGDWYDAARIYREWALQQSWSAEGPLLTRKSIPQWFKEIDEWLLWGATQGKVYSVFDPLFLKPMQEHNIRIGVDLHKWGTHGFLAGAKESPDRFPLPQKQTDFIKRSHETGAQVFGYLQGICWDIGSPSFKREDGWKYAVRNFYGQPLVWELGEHNSIIAYPGEMWEKTLGNTIVKMAKAGFDGAYLDSNNHAGTYLNFNPLYNKQSGGGNEYIKANRGMMRRMKAAAREHRPGFCFTAESFWEGNIAELDAIKAVNTWHRYLKSGVAEQIPLASAVYHDHAILFGCWVGKHSLEQDEGMDYVVKRGMALVEGFKPGWSQPADMLYFKNKELALETSLRRWQAYSAAKKFLLYGEMLRPPQLLSPTERIHFRWWRAWGDATFDTDTPSVLSSLWKAADGSIALVLYNVTAQPQDMTVKLSDLEWEGVSKVAAHSIWPSDLTPSAVLRQPGQVEVSCRIPARSPAVIQINP